MNYYFIGGKINKMTHEINPVELSALEQKLILPDNEVVAVVHPAIAQAIHASLIYWDTRDREKGRHEGNEDDYLLDPAKIRQDRAKKTAGPDYYGPFFDIKKINNCYGTKVGSTFLGLYGVIGEVDLVPDSELVGVAHIPKEVFQIVEAYQKQDNLARFYREFFRQTEGNEWKGRQWNIKVKESRINLESVGNLPFISPVYNWKVEKIRGNILEDGRPLEEQVADYEAALKRFIQRLDAHVHFLFPGTTLIPITPEYAKIHYARLQSGQISLAGLLPTKS